MQSDYDKDFWQECEDYTLKQIRDSIIVPEPYPHLCINEIFHPDCYERIIRHWPSQIYFDGQQIAAGKKYDAPEPDLREILLVSDAIFVSRDIDEKIFWGRFNQFINGQKLSLALVNRVLDQIRLLRRDLPNKVQIRPYACLEWDQEGFSVTPHLDSKSYLMTCIFYTPQDSEDSNLGTALLQPKRELYNDYPNLDKEFITDYFDWHKLDEITRIPYVPNTMLGLIISPISYHSLPEIQNCEGGRKNILLNIYHDFKEPFISLRKRKPEIAHNFKRRDIDN